MGKDFFTYAPQFKLFIAGNHKPSLQNVDEAIRRRLHLLPFTVTIPATERDPELPKKLEAEWSGILAWAIKGCLEWQRIGLNPPKAVIEATEKYLSEEDSLSTWIDECSECDIRSFEKSSDLFASWNSWAERNGEQTWTKKRFVQTMENRGYKAVKFRGDHGYYGLKLIRVDYSNDPRYQ